MEVYNLILKHDNGRLILVKPFANVDKAHEFVKSHAKLNHLDIKSSMQNFSDQWNEEGLLWEDYRAENSKGESLYYVIHHQLLEE